MTDSNFLRQTISNLKLVHPKCGGEKVQWSVLMDFYALVMIIEIEAVDCFKVEETRVKKRKGSDNVTTLTISNERKLFRWTLTGVSKH